jgi:aspartyl-tRNA synthetase
MRSNMCGEVRAIHIGQTISVCGWVASRREHGTQLAFVDVRDHTGVVQCVVDNESMYAASSWCASPAPFGPASKAQ